MDEQMKEFLSYAFMFLFFSIMFTIAVAIFHYLFKYFWPWRFTDEKLRPYYYIGFGILLCGSCCVGLVREATPDPSTLSPARTFKWTVGLVNLPQGRRGLDSRRFNARVETRTSDELVFTVTWGEGREAGQATYRGRRSREGAYSGTYWQNNPEREGTWELRQAGPDYFVGWRRTRNEDPLAFYLIGQEE